MIEPYQWLREHAVKLGLKPENVGPASADLCISADYVEVDYDFITDEVKADGFLYLDTDYFYICSTQEHIYVPETHCAFIQMRSSWARKGLGHKMAGFIDPGFHGQVTLELETASSLVIPVGERIVQIIYSRLTEPTAKPYTGKYLGQRGPTVAYA